MEINLNQPKVQFALQTVQRGAEIARRVRLETTVKSFTKSDHSPVTLADMSIQAVAGALMDQHFPGSALVAEESSGPLQSPTGQEDLTQVTSYVRSFFPAADAKKVCDWIDRGQGVAGDSFWTLDPIDGTKGFLRGGQYAIALALIQDGQVTLAALGCPNLEVPSALGTHTGLLVLAERGKGCWGVSLDDLTRWIPLRVSDCKDITKARILDSVDPGHKNTEKNGMIRRMLGILPDPIPLDSQVKHVVLASGGAEIFFRTLPKKDRTRREKIWDVAAGALAIEEAGGRVTDLEGKPIDYSTGDTLERNPGFLATNGAFHDAVLKVLQKVDG